MMNDDSDAIVRDVLPMDLVGVDDQAHGSMDDAASPTEPNLLPTATPKVTNETATTVKLERIEDQENLPIVKVKLEKVEDEEAVGEPQKKYIKLVTLNSDDETETEYDPEEEEKEVEKEDEEDDPEEHKEKKAEYDPEEEKEEEIEDPDEREEGKDSIDISNQQEGGDSADISSCLLYTSPSPRDKRQSRMPSSA